MNELLRVYMWCLMSPGEFLTLALVFVWGFLVGAFVALWRKS